MYAQTPQLAKVAWPGAPLTLPASILAETGAPAVLSTDDALRAVGVNLDSETSLRWEPLLGRGVISGGGHNVVFLAGNPGEEGLVLIDSAELRTLPLPYLDANAAGGLVFPAAFVTGLAPLFQMQPVPALPPAPPMDTSAFRVAAIIIDPGHGGKDSGAVGTHVIGGKEVKILEKDITLDVGKRLYKRLKASFPGKQILMTRDGDTYPSLPDRVDIANGVPLGRNEAILFVSVHANASFKSAARGYEVWYIKPEYRRTVLDKDKFSEPAEVFSISNAMMEEEYTKESMMIAGLIVDALGANFGAALPSRGIKAENWYVVRNSRMPSVLVELGFVTNREDALLMTSEQGLTNFTDSIYKGIYDFVTKFELSGGFTAAP
jgi:N-acetylmuramoyl-L-alanine amidase